MEEKDFGLLFGFGDLVNEQPKIREDHGTLQYIFPFSANLFVIHLVNEPEYITMN